MRTRQDVLDAITENTAHPQPAEPTNKDSLTVAELTDERPQDRVGQMSDRRMDAYYYSFEKTEADSINKILSAVACAGKAFHHTENWNDEAGKYADHTGITPVDWIQNSAKESAAEIERLRARLAILEAQDKRIREWANEKPDVPAEIDFELGYDAAKSWVREVGLNESHTCHPYKD